MKRIFLIFLCLTLLGTLCACRVRLIADPAQADHTRHLTRDTVGVPVVAAGTQTVFMREIGSTLFFTALERRVSLAPYLCEDVIRVMDEDATRGSALSRALYAYLLNFMDLKKAAQQLGIHRNTLEYQVRKMNAVIGEPPDGSKRFRMMCTYKMLALPDTGVHDV